MPRIAYIGHSAFQLTSGGHEVVIDPFVTGNPTAAMALDQLNPGTILLTHAHNDHVGDAVALSQKTGANVIATYELATFLGGKGAKTIGGNHGGTIQFPGGSAKFVPAWHTSSYGEGGQFVAPGVPAGFVVRFDGRTIYFAGDTCLFGDMQLIGDEGIDLAVLPIGDHFTMGPVDAARAVPLQHLPANPAGCGRLPRHGRQPDRCALHRPRARRVVRDSLTL
jgi:L-ascorbate metabolism protein UlaG (beta-lactamase superfamily)